MWPSPLANNAQPWDTPLPEGISLRLWDGSGPEARLVFEHRGKWLHPLFEVLEFLEGQTELDPGTLVLRDRIIGRGAAFLIVGSGIRRIHGELLSQRALDLFVLRGLVVSYSRLVERIDCMTEDLLAEVEDGAEARGILNERRRLARERMAKRPETRI